jgi:hypothetical protein
VSKLHRRSTRRPSLGGRAILCVNGAERGLWGIAVRRKNWLFFGSDNGGRTAAILTSFIATCKRLEINPFTYLRDIFDRISAHPLKRLEDLIPDNRQAA